MSDIPEAKVILEHGRRCWLWVVRDCPYCHQEHTHGGGKTDGDPRDLLGHRVSHCTTGPGVGGGYVLTANRLQVWLTLAVAWCAERMRGAGGEVAA